MKPTVGFYITKHRDLCNTGKIQGISSWLEWGLPAMTSGVVVTWGHFVCFCNFQCLSLCEET